MVEVSPTNTQEREIIGKWYAGIYTVGEKALLYVGKNWKIDVSACREISNAALLSILQRLALIVI